MYEFFKPVVDFLSLMLDQCTGGLVVLFMGGLCIVLRLEFG